MDLLNLTSAVASISSFAIAMYMLRTSKPHKYAGVSFFALFGVLLGAFFLVRYSEISSANPTDTKTPASSRIDESYYVVTASVESKGPTSLEFSPNSELLVAGTSDGE